MTDYKMTAALAHEIKNPAAVALAHVNLLRFDCDKDDEMSHHLDSIESAITDICDLVRDMLAKAYTHDDTQEVDLYKILTEILITYRAAWPDILFTLSPADDTILLCKGNSTSLRMIFSNLIKNAVEAIEAYSIPPERNCEKSKGKIEINAHYKGNRLHVTIIDTCTSCIPTETRPPLQKPHGNGLGMTICQNLAGGLGAKLSVVQNPTGCTVTVKLRVTGCPSFA